MAWVNNYISWFWINSIYTKWHACKFKYVTLLFLIINGNIQNVWLSHWMRQFAAGIDFVYDLYILWIRLYMITSSNGNIYRVTGHLRGEFTGPGEFLAQRPVTRRFDVFFDLSLNEWLNKRSRFWWFETQLRPLWRHCNDLDSFLNCIIMN